MHSAESEIHQKRQLTENKLKIGCVSSAAIALVAFALFFSEATKPAEYQLFREKLHTPGSVVDYIPGPHILHDVDLQLIPDFSDKSVETVSHFTGLTENLPVVKGKDDLNYGVVQILPVDKKVFLKSVRSEFDLGYIALTPEITEKLFNSSPEKVPLSKCEVASALETEPYINNMVYTFECKDQTTGATLKLANNLSIAFRD